MDNKENIQNELSGIAPELARLKKENSLTAPPHYFDNFADDIMAKVDLEPVHSVKLKSQDEGFSVTEIFSRLISPRVAMVAASFVVVALTVILWQSKQDAELTLSFKTLPDMEVQNFIFANVEDYEMEVLEEYISDDEAGIFDTHQDIDYEMIENYLDDEVDQSLFEEVLM